MEIAKFSAAVDLADFLERYPLYRRWAYPLRHRSLLHEVAPRLHCRKCREFRTFLPILESGHAYVRTPGMPGPLTFRINTQPDIMTDKVTPMEYRCPVCLNDAAFAIHVSDGYESIQKVGQYPPPDIAIPKPLARALGEHTQEFSRGLASEAEGFGIGAFAYYRRIVETTVENLLCEIEQLLPDADKPRYQQQLALVRQQHTAEARIKLVKDFIPANLRVGGMNPLDVIYSILSANLHAGSDQECLEYAEAVRVSLVYLLDRIEQHKTASRGFTDGMRKLLDKVKGSGPK